MRELNGIKDLIRLNGIDSNNDYILLRQTFLAEAHSSLIVMASFNASFDLRTLWSFAPLLCVKGQQLLTLMYSTVFLLFVCLLFNK